MKGLYWIAISIAVSSCSSSAKPEPPNKPSVATAPVARSAADAAVAVASPDAAIAPPTDDRHPRIFPWAEWRHRNEKWLSNPSDDHCDPRNRHLPRKGESECYPPSNVQLAGIITLAQRAKYDEEKVLLTIDRGYSASVTTDYLVSVLDADERPATRWVHPSVVERDFSQFELPIRTHVLIERGITHAAIVERLTTDERFPDSDPRSQP